MSLRNSTPVSALLLIVGFFFCCAAHTQTELVNADLSQQMEGLDDAFQQVSGRFYPLLVKKIATRSDLDSLDQLIKSGGPMAAASLREQRNFLYDNFRSPTFKKALAFLYQINDTANIQLITRQLNQSGPGYVQTYNYYLLAKYYYDRAQWSSVVEALNRVDVKDLDLSDAHYSDLLKGAALQGLKRHRDASKFYQLVPEESPYYAHARLNIGLTYLRQGWWSEAHLEFERAIKALPEDEIEFKNRVYVTYGFSQIHHEFYRDARKTLRNVSLDSGYVNKALLGLGVAAGHQKDFGGAINAFNRLTKEKAIDINVDEAQLLVPVIFEQLKLNSKALAAYQEAIIYYQTRISALQQAKHDLKTRNMVSVPELLRQMDAKADELYGKPQLIPDYILNNYQTLLDMESIAREKQISFSFEAIKKRYEDELKSLIETNIALRESMLSSYLSQAKFGVAQLYDKP